MNHEKIVGIYDDLINSLKDKRYLESIWFKCIKTNAFFDNYLKFYFFQEGIKEGYYPLTHFTKENTWNIKILETWNTYKADLETVLPHNSPRPIEFLLDLCWLSNDGYKMPLCMEIEQSKNFTNIVYDFKKMLFLNSSLKIMIFFNYSVLQSLLDILLEMPKSNNEETFLFISLEYAPINLSDIQRSPLPNERFYRIMGSLYADRVVKELSSNNFSICIDLHNCIENINTKF